MRIGRPKGSKTTIIHEKICNLAECGKEFVTTAHNAKYCSESHKLKDYYRNGRPNRSVRVVRNFVSTSVELTQLYDVVFISVFDKKRAMLDLDNSIQNRWDYYNFERSEPVDFRKYKHKIYATIKMSKKSYPRYKTLKENSEYGVYDFIIISIQKKYPTKYDVKGEN
jgi:hypothetical protein